MLSNKWTFSLTSFVMLIAFGLVIYAPSVAWQTPRSATHDFGVTISPAEKMIDVVADNGGMEIASGRDRKYGS